MNASKPVTNERRKNARATTALDMRFQLAAQSGFARIQDISSSGVRCVTDRLMPLMTQVELVIVIPDSGRSREISCRGAVVRSGPIRAAAPRGTSDPAFETAIFFTDMKDTDRMDVEQFVRSIGRPQEL